MNKKKTLVILLIISSALLWRPARRLWLILLLVGWGAGGEVAAQFFQGIGITAGVTKAKQKWFVLMPDSSTEILKKKNRIGFNGSLRAEFINSEYVRWITEFQFNQKGCKDKTDSATYKNRLNYICWNNFLKLQFETFEGFPYLLMGPRVEYLLNKKITSPALTGDFKKFNFSWSVGVGFEKIVYSYFKPFIEIHYNPDTPFYYAYETVPLDIRNRAWELRIGLIFRPGGHDSCPSIVY
jgi:hypothetical protein